MKYKQANLEICKQIINNGFVRGQEISDELFLIIPNEGYYGYYIDEFYGNTSIRKKKNNLFSIFNA